MRRLRFAMLGAGFWARYQLAGWNEAGGAECVALYNRTRSKAEQLAQEFGISKVYENACDLIRQEPLDFVDIVTNAETHRELVTLAAEHGLPAICQKPMAASLADSCVMVEICRRSGVPFFIHENWRWQTPIRALHQVLSCGEIGRPFRARIRMVSAFRVFENQPFLKHLDRFLLVDMGSHILDVARFLFGEPKTVYCRVQRVQSDIKGDDLATVVLGMENGATVVCELGYPGTPMFPDSFPQTFIYVEAERGTAEIALDYHVRITTAAGTREMLCPPPRYAWADPQYDLVHASIVPCHEDLLRGLRGERRPETTGEDNLKTVRLVYSAYESADSGEVARL
jgi:predicted dehydrogenase